MSPLIHELCGGAGMCEDCPAGTYCLSGEGAQFCPAGHYCLGGGVEGILPCPPGTYNPQLGLSQVEQCLICPAGESVVIQLSLVPGRRYTFKLCEHFVIFCNQVGDFKTLIKYSCH